MYFSALIILFATHSIVAQVNILPPKLNISRDEEYPDDWHYFDGNSSIVIVQPIGIQLAISCQASYPISWEWSGNWEGTILRLRDTRRDVADGHTIDDVSGFVYSSEIWSTLPENVSISGSLTCRSVDDNSLFNKLSFFVPGQPFSTIAIRNQTILCPSTNPEDPVELFRKDLRGKTSKVSASFDPLVGFHLPQLLPGTYTCTSSQISRSVTLNPNEILASPNTTTLTAFDNEEVKLLCESEDGIRVTSSSRRAKVTYLTTQSAQIVLTSRISEGPQTVTCRTTHVEHIWSIKTIDPPWIHFNQEQGEIDCITDEPAKSISTLRCSSPNDCRVLKKCFEDKSCYTGDYYFEGKYSDALCTFDDQTHNCSSIRPSHRHGLVKCGVADKFMVFEFFSGLSLILHDNWKSAKTLEIIRLDEVDRVLYTNETQYFLCEVNPFVFDDGLKFSVGFKNGSIQALPSGTFSVDTSTKTTERLVFEYSNILAINVVLGIDIVEVFCHAPLRESYDWMNVSRTFEMRHLTRPVIVSTEVQHVFVEGASNARLSCETKGEPLPKVTWLRNGQALPAEFKTTHTVSGESFLDFPRIDSDYEGEYVCRARNKNGVAEKTFHVDVDEPSSERAALIGGIVSCAVGVLILSALLFIAWRRHKITRALLRNLTDNEVNEFLNGSPNHLQIDYSDANAFDRVQYLPYNSVYEIPWKDLCFDEKSAPLGSGAFGLVVKGRVKSYSSDDSDTDCEVAIKTTKPSAGVDVFKALLSELKIMIYIEKQENIVNLIGACTENIRERHLYIVVELCPLGSLEKYLRTNKGAFVNHLVDGQIVKRQMYENIIAPRVSTHDLLRWSHQIANGMEYLQSRKVIHGDLATRNILLNKSKVAKITDFGLSKQTYENMNYVKTTKTPLPWRWMALESLQYLEFSSKSDIWAYGVILYEIFTLGELPWQNDSWGEEFVKKLESGERLKRPAYASQQIYDVMMQCWDTDMDQRPPFLTLKEYFLSVYKELDLESPGSSLSLIVET